MWREIEHEFKHKSSSNVNHNLLSTSSVHSIFLSQGHAHRSLVKSLSTNASSAVEFGISVDGRELSPDIPFSGVPSSGQREHHAQLSSDFQASRLCIVVLGSLSLPSRVDSVRYVAAAVWACLIAVTRIEFRETNFEGS